MAKRTWKILVYCVESSWRKKFSNNEFAIVSNNSGLKRLIHKLRFVITIQFAPQHRHGLTAQDDSIAAMTDMDDASAR